jgi:hypothetical protein
VYERVAALLDKKPLERTPTMNTKLTVPPVGFDLSAIDQAGLAPRSAWKYHREISKYLETGGTLADTAAIMAYASALKPSSEAFFKSALRIITLDLE